jgi:hypothetical protein
MPSRKTLPKSGESIVAGRDSHSKTVCCTGWSFGLNRPPPSSPECADCLVSDSLSTKNLRLERKSATNFLDTKKWTKCALSYANALQSACRAIAGLFSVRLST